MAKVTISSVIDAPVEKVWARIRDFNGLPSWHPRMVESHIEDGKDPGTIGCVRNFQLASGARIREKLLDFSDGNFLVSYSILETPQPLTNHKATLQLRRVTDGDRTYAEWTASFDAPPE
ncbi:MAG: SRPBCC family protein, partial [Mesorhizobium sp.]